jgi:hypothetical protein
METINKIIFYNHFHNGDIHLSRTFVRKIIDHIKKTNPNIEFYYAQKNSPLILADISNLLMKPEYLKYISSEHLGDFTLGKTLFINTWYACNKHLYMNQYGITFDCLYALFDDVCQRNFNFSLTDISKDPVEFFPEIDYTYYNIQNIDNWIKVNTNKKIFVSNCTPLSGQSHNIDLVSIICNLAKIFTNYIFILTNKTNIGNMPPNIIYSSDIIKSQGFDLNENSYISTFCDLIIGPASGAFTFSMVKSNFFNRKPTIIALCNLIPNKSNKFWLGKMFEDKINYSANIIVSNESEIGKITNIIKQEL